jgi:hypothetical protein
MVPMPRLTQRLKNTPVTLDELTLVGESLYGEHWQSPLFTDIGWGIQHGFKVTKSGKNHRDIPLRIKQKDGTLALLRDVLRDLLTERLKAIQSTRWLLDTEGV